MIKLIYITEDHIKQAKTICPIRASISDALNINIANIRVNSLIQVKINNYHYILDKKVSNWLVRLDYFINKDINLPDVIKPFRFGLNIDNKILSSSSVG